MSQSIIPLKYQVTYYVLFYNNNIVQLVNAIRKHYKLSKAYCLNHVDLNSGIPNSNGINLILDSFPPPICDKGP